MQKSEIKMTNNEWKNKRLSWDEKHMLAALSAASRSSCKYLHSGADIIKNKRIIAEGYNGAIEGTENCLEIGCRKDELGIPFELKGTGTCRGRHAEANAIDEKSKSELKGTTMYTVYYPCSECAKDIAANGISEVVYLKMYREPDSLTKELFEKKNIKIRKLELDINKIFGVMRDVYNE